MRKYLLITVWFIGSVTLPWAQTVGGGAAPAPAEPAAVALGEAINSMADEFFPVLSPDGHTLYLTRDRHAQNIGPDNRRDAWVTYRLPEGAWSRTVNAGAPLNDRNDNRVVSVSPSGRRLYLVQQAANTVQLLESRREGRSWSRPKVLDLPTGIHPVTIHPSTDGQVVLFSTPAANGSLDLFCIRRQPDGRWTAPANLGPAINTVGDEKEILLTADGETLYFTSNGHPGRGGQDWFMSRRLDNSWIQWSPPQHLGEVINTSRDDGPIAVSNQGGEVYFSRWTEQEGYNLYRTVLPEALRPRPVAIISGRISTIGRTAYTPRLTVSPLEERKGLRQLEVEPDGRYTLIIPFGSDAGLSAEATGYYAVSEHFKMAPERIKELDAGTGLLATRDLDPSYLQRESEIQDLQLRLRKLDDELRRLSLQRQNYRDQLRSQAPSGKITDPQLEALRHRFNYFVFQDTSKKDSMPRETTAYPETYEMTIKGGAGTDEELTDLKKEFRDFFGNEEEKDKEQWLWEEGVSPETAPETDLGDVLLFEATQEALADLTPEEQRLLRLREAQLRDQIRAGLSAPGRPSGMTETENTNSSDWQLHLEKDALFNSPSPVGQVTGSDQELKDFLKEALQSDLVYTAKAGYQNELSRELETKLSRQIQTEEQLMAKGVSLKNAPATKEKKKPALQEVQKDLQLVPVEPGQIIPLNNIFFEANTARLKKASDVELDRLVQFLQQNDNLTIEIGAHTHGGVAHAQAMTLTEQRAAAVANYLLFKGISPSRVEYRGYGKTHPLTTNETEEGRRQNQRIEMKILAEGL